MWMFGNVFLTGFPCPGVGERLRIVHQAEISKYLSWDPHLSVHWCRFYGSETLCFLGRYTRIQCLSDATHRDLSYTVWVYNNTHKLRCVSHEKSLESFILQQLGKCGEEKWMSNALASWARHFNPSWGSYDIMLRPLRERCMANNLARINYMN